MAQQQSPSEMQWPGTHQLAWEVAAIPCFMPFPWCGPLIRGSLPQNPNTHANRANAPVSSVAEATNETFSPTLPAANTPPSPPRAVPSQDQFRQRQAGPATRSAGDEAASGPSTGARGARRTRLWAHIHLHMHAPGFDLVPRLIGRGGCNMRKIADSTGAKIRIRGRGSGHLEIEGKFEAPTPLMVAVTTDKMDEEGFRAAVAATIEELRIVEQRFRSFCQQRGLKHEGPCYSIGSLPDKAKDCLGHDLMGLPRSVISGSGAAAAAAAAAASASASAMAPSPTVVASSVAVPATAAE